MNKRKDLFPQVEVNNQVLLDIIEGKYPGHAFIIAGNNPALREKTVRFLVEAILCVGKERPCGECDACALSRSGNHPDLTWISPQGQKIKIQQIREMQHSASLKTVGDLRVVVIENADDMTVEAANSLLKILEEPPPGTMFFLTATKMEALLPTIISRCVGLNMGYVDSRINPDWLPQQEIDEILAKRELCCLFALVNKVEKQRDKAIDFLNYLKQYYRGKLANRLEISPFDKKGLQKEAKILEQILLAQTRLENNGNIRLILDALMLNLAKETSNYCFSEWGGEKIAEGGWGKI